MQCAVSPEHYAPPSESDIKSGKPESVTTVGTVGDDSPVMLFDVRGFEIEQEREGMVRALGMVDTPVDDPRFNAITEWVLGAGGGAAGAACSGYAEAVLRRPTAGAAGRRHERGAATIALDCVRPSCRIPPPGAQHLPGPVDRTSRPCVHACLCCPPPG